MMNKLIKLVKKFQQSSNDNTFSDIVDILNPIIKHQIENIPSYYQDDIYQEILMKISKALLRFNLDNQLISNEYRNSFMAKYGKIVSEFDNEYKLFCFENQFIKYIIKICKSCVSDYYRHNKTKNISLNKKDHNQIELIDTICESINLAHNDILDLNSEDLFIIDLWINKKYTQKEIGQILGISQQAVCKRIKKIKKNLNSGC